MTTAEKALDLAATLHLTQEDFAELAMLCADQAGMSTRDQLRLKDLFEPTPQVSVQMWTAAQDAQADIGVVMRDAGYVAPENHVKRQEMADRVAKDLNAIAQAFAIVPPNGGRL